MQNCHRFTVGEPKFSLFRSMIVADASRPTTAGRRPVKMLCTTCVFMYFINILLISIISMKDGSTSEKVDVNEPSMARALPIPALWMAV